MWREFLTKLETINTVSILVRLSLATLIGGILGINRARQNRPAGLRTHMLVCVGATLVMMTNQYIATIYPGADPTRLGAQVISGIGFLGAGTIIVSQQSKVLGLTTAAGLWATACVGLALGIGFYPAAIIGGIFLIFIIITLDSSDEWIKRTAKNVRIYMEFSEPKILTEIITLLTQSSVKVQHVEMIEAKYSKGSLAAIILMELPQRGTAPTAELLDELSNYEGIVYLNRL